MNKFSLKVSDIVEEYEHTDIIYHDGRRASKYGIGYSVINENESDRIYKTVFQYKSERVKSEYSSEGIRAAVRKRILHSLTKPAITDFDNITGRIVFRRWFIDGKEYLFDAWDKKVKEIMANKE